MQIAEWMRQALHAAKQRRHRLVLVLQGAPGWCRAEALAAWHAAEATAGVWLGEVAVADMPLLAPGDYRQALGSEHDLLVVDALDALPANAFAALSGTLIGGGVLILLWPDEMTDRFRLRCEALWRDRADIHCYRQSDARLMVPAARPTAPVPQALTEDQREAVIAVLRVAQGHRHRPVALIADRGRGKSAVLGMAAAQLQTLRARRILVTAPRVEAVASVFRHAAQGWPQARSSRLSLRHAGGSIEFFAVDALLRELPEADLLLVDEAAAIGTPLLQALVQRYPRIAFATTVHGYEGSGRGFDLRFAPSLDQLAPGWRRIVLEEPVRWAPDDPLEELLRDMLLLDAEPCSIGANADLDSLRLSRVSANALAEDAALLSAVFGLLTQAHYQTTPDDLRLLLDDPALNLWVGFVEERPVAVCLCVDEGGFDEVTAESIWRAERRPRGHLLAQSMAVHGGLRDSLRLRGRRILRIAVHAQLRRCGLGTRLVRAVIDASAADALDYLGSSFAGAADVLGFWEQSGLKPVRLGVHRDSSSGQYSLQVLLGLSEDGCRLVGEAREEFAEALPLLLSDSVQDLDSALALRLLVGIALPSTLAQRDRELLTLYAQGLRVYESILPSLHQLLRRLPVRALSETDAPLLVARLAQRNSWQDCARRFGASGRKALEQRLRQVVEHLVSALH